MSQAVIPYLAYAAMAASSVYTGVSQYNQGKAQQEALDIQAIEAKEASEQEARRIQGQERRVAGAQRAQFAGMGVDLSGTAFDLQLDTASQFRVDALTALTFGKQKSAGLRTQGSMAYTSGRNALVSSGFDTAGSVLGASYYYKTGKMPSWR
jgi:hypothetical protein